MDADIQGAFDNISHDFLLNQIKGFPGITWIKQWLVAGFIEQHCWHPTLSGTPQGGIISPLLSNIALHGMEDALNIKRTPHGVLKPASCALVRYADDFVVFCETREKCEQARATLQSWLKERGLKFSEEKTRIRHMTEGFEFLGFYIRHYPVKNRKQPYIFLSKPSKSSIKHYRQLVKDALKRSHSWPMQAVIPLLTPVINGWCNYFRIGATSDTFAYLDQWMWIKLKRFVARRHPNKSSRWQCERYWGKIAGREDRWVFIDKSSGKYLPKLAWTSIRRHILVRGDASPDNPALQDYWQNRRN